MYNSLLPRAVEGPFDGLFLGELIAFGAVTILFLFYFNRVFAIALSTVINSYLWTFYRVTVRIQAIQFSPLAGRIFVKGVRYHGQNETICIHDGYITWRYWFRRVAEAEATAASRLKESGKSHAQGLESGGLEDSVPVSQRAQSRPCRVQANLRGLEWFIYNRKPAYDSILSTIVNKTLRATNDSDSHREGAASGGPSVRVGGGLDEQLGASALDGNVSSRRSNSNDSATSSTGGFQSAPTVPDLPKYLELFPISITCSKAAMVMGNAHTRSVLVAKFETFHGRINAHNASPLDCYRQSFDFEGTNASAAFKHNHDFEENQLAAGARIRRERHGAGIEESKTSWLAAIRANLREARRKFEDIRLFPRWSNASVASEDSKPRPSMPRNRATSAGAQDHWVGLSRYLLEDDDAEIAQERWKSVEYARVQSIFDVPKLQMSFYWDVAGPVTTSIDPSVRRSIEPLTDRVNGGPAPAYGLELNIGGGTINYGPWADRQRAEIQSIFFPASFSTAQPAEPIRKGSLRISTIFNISCFFDDEVVLRVHTREPSKDARWKAQLDSMLRSTAADEEAPHGRSKKGASAALNPEIRPAAWIELALAKDSCMVYDMDMLARHTGYKNSLQVDARDVRVSTSVNHDVFLRTELLQVKGDLSNPLHWNTLHNWRFDIMSPDLELFILRDHAFLLTDLVNDWTSGPAGNFFEFVPYVYKLGLRLPDFKIYLNTNDVNIVNNATSVEENAFILLGGQSLHALMEIPTQTFQPVRNKVSFDIDAANLGIDLVLPSWTTQRSFMLDTQVATLGSLKVNGSYNYYTSTSAMLTDTVLLNISGSQLRLFLYGFLVRYFMNFKDNYFGDYLHFQTQEEFQLKIEPSSRPDDAQEPAIQDERIVNDLDVLLMVHASDTEIILPSQLYTADEHVAIDVNSISLDLRFTNYYMDMQVDFTPLSVSHQSLRSDDVGSGPDNNKTQIFVDGATIIGHRLFGLPRSEPTYVCNWDFSIGKILGEGDLPLFSSITGAARSFAYGFKDLENALQRSPIVEHDVIFLRANIQPIKLWLHVADSAFLLDVGHIKFSLNDWAGDYYSECMRISVPKVVLACVDAHLATRNRGHGSSDVPTLAFLETSLNVILLEAKPNFEEARRLQQGHIEMHDSRTKRTPWLLRPGTLNKEAEAEIPASKLRPPAMLFPPMPDPLKADDVIFNTGSNSSSFAENSRIVETPGIADANFRENFDDNSGLIANPLGLGLGITKGTQAAVAFNETGTTKKYSSSTGSIYPRASNLALSGTYHLPYFPLMGITPSSDDVPVLPSQRHEVDLDFDDSGLSDFSGDRSGKCLTVFVNLDGVRGLVTPDAMAHIATLASELQPTTSQKILDDLQAEAISEEQAKRIDIKSRTLQLRLTLPAGRIRFLSRPDEERSSHSHIYRYDASLGRLQIMVQDCLNPLPIANKKAAYLRLDSIQVTARSEDALGATMAQISLNVSQIISWVVQKSSARGHLQIGDIQLSSPDHDTKGLAPLLVETVQLSTQITELFATIGDAHRARVIKTMVDLMIKSKEVPEAPFSTTTSFILRTASFHPRNTDSWKMVCRLRWILQSVYSNGQVGRDLCKNGSQDQSPLTQVRSEVLWMYAEWRGWDLVDPASASVIRTAFEADRDLSLPPSADVPMEFSVSLSRLITAIDPELATNVIMVEDFRTTVSRELSKSSRTTAAEQWKVQMATSKANLSVDWNIVEIMEGILKSVPLSKSVPKTQKSSITKAVAASPSSSIGIHVVFSVNDFNARAEALNVEATCSTGGFISSVCFDLSDGNLHQAHAIVHSETIKSEVTSKCTPLVTSTLIQPTIHSSWHAGNATITPRPQLKAGGLCKDIALTVEQDLLGLLGVADRVVSEEIRYLSNLQNWREKAAEHKATDTTTVASTSSDPFHVEVHLGLLLESYNFSARLLSSLRYVLRGETARSTIHYAPKPEPTVSADFDLGLQSHMFVNVSGEETHEVAKVLLPPLNGQITGSLAEKTTTIGLRLALKPIVLDASALHALFSTYSRAELLSFRSEVSRDLKLLRANFNSIDLGTQEKPTRKLDTITERQRVLIYRACMSAAGLKIKARTGKGSAYSARLTFDLGHVHFQIDNRGPNGGARTLPEMAAKVQLLSIVLKRSTEDRNYRCGDFSIGGSFIGTTRMNDEDVAVRSYEVTTTDLDINIHPETASTIVDIIGYLQQRFKSFNLSEEINTLTLRARRMRTKSRSMALRRADDDIQDTQERFPTTLFSSMYSLEMNYIQATWHVTANSEMSPVQEIENLIFSLTKVKLATERTNSGRLILENMQLQMAPPSQPKRGRSRNSALLPEVVFNAAYLSTDQDRRLAFQAAGKSLDLRLTSQSIISAANLTKSIGAATRDLRKVIADWNAAFVREEQSNKNILGNKRLSSVLIAADFAGAIVHIQGKDRKHSISSITQSLSATNETDSQSHNSPMRTVDLQAPGIALKLEYTRPESEDPSLSVETKVNASSNTLHPTVVPLFWEMSESLKEIVGGPKAEDETPATSVPKASDGDVLTNTDPEAVLGRTRLSLGLRISKQQFGFTCNPIARVAANAQFESIYLTISTVQAPDQSRFFALTSSIVALQCSLQHVYSREPTGSFSIERVDLSLINSKHISKATGISAILKISPMNLHVNAKQMQDFFLFSEVWFPTDMVHATASSPQKERREAAFGVQRYQQVAATGAFPWNASITISKLNASVDLGQALGKSAFSVENLWVSSRKSSDWEQNLCLGFDKIGIDGSGRMSGSIQLHTFRLRTSIHWPDVMRQTDFTPLIEASTSFGGFSAKLAFDYQAVVMADFSSLDFLMYNVRDPSHASGDRLVCFVNGDKVHAFCTTQSSAQLLALYQAITRLIQEKRSAYEVSLRDVEKFMQRRTSTSPTTLVAMSALKSPEEKKKKVDLIPRQLQTNVVISLKAVKVGAYPRSFFDQQIFKVEALDARARFSVRSVQHGKTAGQLQSGLGMSLGQVRVALSSLTQRVERKAFEDMDVADVVSYSTGSRGGTVLKVPRLLAEMQTWQAPDSFHIDYLFRSAFEGKVEVGWNYSRISYIRGMWGSHARALAQRLGRPLPLSAVQISGGLPPDQSEQEIIAAEADAAEQGKAKAEKEKEEKEKEEKEKEEKEKEKEEKEKEKDDKKGKGDPAKITAVVNVPLSRYDYTAVEPPLIVTPQLRDMGEATPPLEWIGLQRERLPHLTHQVVIVPLLEVAKEVEDAYVRILGGS